MKKLLKKQVENGGDIYFIDINYKKPIHHAASFEGPGLLKYLISKECNVNF